jgi:hypothetical protein
MEMGRLEIGTSFPVRYQFSLLTKQRTNSLTVSVNKAAIVIAAVAVLWAIIASWLTANEVIGVATEFTTYSCSFGSVLVCGLLNLWLRSNRRLLSTLLKIVAILGALTVIIVACRFSDGTFTFWKMRTVKPSEWHQMISDLLMLDKRGRETNTKININHDETPKSFGSLGLLSDCMGGHAGIGNDPAIFYGVKSRRWGLEIGSNDFSHGRWATFKRVQVGENAWFFVGSDD